MSLKRTITIKRPLFVTDEQWNELKRLTPDELGKRLEDKLQLEANRLQKVVDDYKKVS